MGCMSWGFRCLHKTEQLSNTCWKRGYWEVGKVCCQNVRQIQFNGSCWWCTFGALFQKAKILRSGPPAPTRSALVQHIRRAAYQSACIRGARLWSVRLKRRILHNGAGNKKKTSGVSYGWSFHQLLRVVSNLLNTSARPNVKDVASVTSLVLAAQQCAAVPVQMINVQVLSQSW